MILILNSQHLCRMTHCRTDPPNDVMRVSALIWTRTRKALLLRTDSCYVPCPWLISPNYLLCFWLKHNSVLWLLNFLVTAPSTGELLYRIWTTAASCEGPGGRHVSGRNALRDLWKLSGWLSVKLCVSRHTAAYSTWVARGGRRGGGNVHRTDIFRALIFYSFAVFLTHAPM